MNAPIPSRPAPLARVPLIGQWGLLIALSVAFVGLCEMAGLPAALLFGPMAAAILVETGGGAIRVPGYLRFGAQAIIGCLLARAVTPEIIGTFIKAWPLFIGSAVATTLVAGALGWTLAKLKVLPGSTAVWGISPGAATASILMAGEFGADARLVAFMQYLRVVFVAGAASIVGQFWAHTPSAAFASASWFQPVHWLPFAEMLVLAVGGGLVGRAARIPGGVLLVPMFAGAALHGGGFIDIELPRWLLAVCFGLLGWMVGLNFSRDVFAKALGVLPRVILSILVLMAFCALLAFVLVKSLGVDPLTAYLATSPGGMDTVAVIAASTNVDLSFVMAFQTIRLLVVLTLGPAISRFISRRLQKPPSP